MSWRIGSRIFIEIWPILQKHIEDEDERIEFTAALLKLFTERDMDTYDIEDVHAEIRAAMKEAGIELAEPEEYEDD
ncbi:hypothetical protein [Methylophilus sp. Leaf414]|uniref:hypothetical protein n=1 Tax=Methylophilus sp. Leaf414 TaxID=1736371 RepID=UPI0006FF0546|nr:hypothetical protein [Methylophilus sp. Leaf414]KQT38210.1 hypothetical protein ASG24_04455 [Methylophilus sp. Leaf414]